MAAPKASVLGSSKTVTLEEGVFGAEVKPHLVHEIDPERNLLLVKGAVPGPKNGYVEVREDTGRGRA